MSGLGFGVRVPAVIPVSHVWRPDGTLRPVTPLAMSTSPDEVVQVVRRHLAER